MAFSTGYNMLGPKGQGFGGFHPGMEFSMPVLLVIPGNCFQEFTDQQKIFVGNGTIPMSQSVDFPETKVDEQETLGVKVDDEEETLGAVVDGEETLGAVVDGEETLGAYVDGEETQGAYVDGEEIPKWVEEMAEEHVYNELNDPNSEQSKAYACFISEQSQVSESLKCPMGCGSLKEEPHFSVCKGCHLIIGYQKKFYGLSPGQAQIKLKEWNSQMSDTPEESRAGFTPCMYGNSCHYWDQNACASIDPVTGETKHWGQPIKGGCGRGHRVGLTRINYITGEREFARVEPGRGQVWVNKYGWELILGAELVRWKETPPSKSSD